MNSDGAKANRVICHYSLVQCVLLTIGTIPSSNQKQQTVTELKTKVRYAVSDCIIEWNQHVNTCAVERNTHWDPAQTGSPPAAGARASVSNLCIIIRALIRFSFFTTNYKHFLLRNISQRITENSLIGSMKLCDKRWHCVALEFKWC